MFDIGTTFGLYNHLLSLFVRCVDQNKTNRIQYAKMYNLLLIIILLWGVFIWTSLSTASKMPQVRVASCVRHHIYGVSAFVCPLWIIFHSPFLDIQPVFSWI